MCSSTRDTIHIGIVGSRTFPESRYDEYFHKIRAITDTAECITGIYGLSSEVRIVSGGAIGADAFASYFVDRVNKYSYLSYTLKEYLPDWDSHGKSAGHIRNEKIVSDSDMIIAIWDGKSKGTQDTIRLAKKEKVPTIILYF